jgi:uncharacterized protein (DUF924 family)
MSSALKSLSTLPQRDQSMIREVLQFWFGHVEETATPTAARAHLWFDAAPDIDQLLRDQFETMLVSAANGDLDHWLSCAHGQLALILLLDQFARHIYRGQPEAYAYDAKALQICIEGATQEQEHELSLIERVFYYYPLLHVEEAGLVRQSVHAYALLERYALEETKPFYQKFLGFAREHTNIIEIFGRYPSRNVVLNRHSTDEEVAYLRQYGEEQAS